MNGTIGNSNPNERGLLPYPVILAATKGDPGAMSIVVQHCANYIAYLSTRKVRDKYGSSYYGIDEDIRERLQAKLMRLVLQFDLERLQVTNLGKPSRISFALRVLDGFFKICCHAGKRVQAVYPLVLSIQYGMIRR